MVGGGSKHSLPSWIGAAASRAGFDRNMAASGPKAVLAEDDNGLCSSSSSSSSKSQRDSNELLDFDLGIGERAFSAAGAAVLSAILVNPLDVVKTRLQAQAAGVLYSHNHQHIRERVTSFRVNPMYSHLRCSASCTCAGFVGTEAVCPPETFQYKGTLDVFFKIIRQEGFTRLWRGTNAALALAIPTVGIYLPCYDIFRNWMENLTKRNAPQLTPYVPLVAGSMARSLAVISCYPVELARTRMQAFKEIESGVKPPGVWKTLLGVVSPIRSSNNIPNLQGYHLLWTGVGAQLARDVPFSAICWSTLEPVRRRILNFVGEDVSASTILGANFSAGFLAGSIAATVTCPLDVAKTRRQIEKDPSRALSMNTRLTLIEVWRNGGMKGLFTGVGPRVARVGPSTGIVVSFYEVMKYMLHQRQATQGNVIE
ncbi:hypothetical protein Sjap_005245 [Stephania japonica]|uniref:Mitochondrial carrier protein n=1 Tax=Stephania japonica TaxID=461633 RepID=A0AAP0PIK1_9MAGN